MARKFVFVTMVVSGVLVGTAAQAWHVKGNVACDANGNGEFDAGDLILDNVLVRVVNTSGTFTGSDLTPDYFISLPDINDSFRLFIVSGLPADATFVSPASGEHLFSTSLGNEVFTLNFLITSAICTPPNICWMTGGGVKFERVTKTWNAESGPRDTVGGNVFPSCSQFPGNGGNWNHIAHSLKLHLLGTDIDVLRCGNVDGIPPGTESPVCGVNFIEFEGTGTVQGIGGSKAPTVDAFFFGRVEDRNEPGNEQSADAGEDIDRYFLRCVDGDGNLLILVDADGIDDGAVDPLTITGGNFQIHCTSCDDTGGGGGSGLPLHRRSTYFLRGDANTDGAVDIADPIYSLTNLFLSGAEPRCATAADANDDGDFNISDPVMSLAALFSGSPPIPQPFPEAGLDPTEDYLDCKLFEQQ